jgi:transcriptional regulator with GAF, ATPase, and Fis domain
VAATHQDLELAVRNNRFRDDLYSRLAGHVLSLPPLRERKEDLGIILSALCQRHLDQPSEELHIWAKAMLFILQRDYQHNIRELEHVLIRALALASPSRRITTEHIAHTPEAPPIEPSSRGDRALAERLQVVLEENGGNIAAAGRSFGKAPAQIRR